MERHRQRSVFHDVDEPAARLQRIRSYLHGTGRREARRVFEGAVD